MTYDFIIIGGGLGGLTAGAKLAKEGKKVLLLEQHDRPGGCATTFKRKEFTMEVGLHEMEGLYPRDKKMKMFEDLGLLERVKFLDTSGILPLYQWPAGHRHPPPGGGGQSGFEKSLPR